MFTRKHIPSCDSTNDAALAWAKEGASHKSLITCDVQTKGKGRQGNSWLHYAGGLACSLIIKPKINIQEAARVTLVTAVAVQQGLEQLKLNTLVKWPNDLLLEDGRKLAGILTESQSQSGDVKAIVIGIGLNIQRLADAPPEYGFLSDIGYLGSRSEVLEAILETLEFHIDHLNTPGHFGFCLNYLRKHSATIGRPVTNGIAVDINSDGSLLVQDSQGKLSSMYT